MLGLGLVVAAFRSAPTFAVCVSEREARLQVLAAAEGGMENDKNAML